MAGCYRSSKELGKTVGIGACYTLQVVAIGHQIMLKSVFLLPRHLDFYLISPNISVFKKKITNRVLIHIGAEYNI